MPHRVPLFPAPAAQHHALATQALDAGKHCFVEKPLSLTYDEGAALGRGHGKRIKDQVRAEKC